MAIVHLIVGQDHCRCGVRLGLVAINNFCLAKKRERGVALLLLGKGDPGIDQRDPSVVALRADILLASRRQGLGFGKGRVSANEVALLEVDPPEVVPRGRILLLVVLLDGFEEHLLP